MLDGYAALVGARHARAALGEDAPAGTSPAVVVAPGGEDEAAAVLAHASASGHAVLLKGGGTKLDWGRPPARCDVVLSTERLAGVVSHDAGDLVCTVRAGTRLADLRAIVEAETQTSPYRKVRVRAVEDAVEGAQVRTVADRVHDALDRLPGRRGRVGRIRLLAQQIRGSDGGAGRLADAAAEAAELDAEERYRILAEPDVLRRLDVLIGILDAKGPTAHKDLPARADPTLN